MRGLLDRIERAKRPPFHAVKPIGARAAYAAGAEMLEPPRIALRRVEDLTVAGLPARLYAPSHDKLPTLLCLHGGGFLLDTATIDWFFEHTTLRSQRHDWRFAPLEADELSGVAPACVIVAECDPLADEGIADADKLRIAGVPVNLELVRGVTHDFIKMGRMLKEAGVAQQFAADALQQAWRNHP
jgi:acetyl esterase/lipase